MTDLLSSYYEELHRRGVVKTKKQFSTDWCGRSDNYLNNHIGTVVPSDVHVRLIKQAQAHCQFDFATQMMSDLFAGAL